ncbi:hypothetical protein BGW41_001422 [Actinomortierella wolfii]|nr:hypothetical protein BGW41_001422 [Actinomortierella wolfii]
MSTSLSRGQRLSVAFIAIFFLPLWIALTVVVYAAAWLIYLRYAQTDAPQPYPFLPYHPIRVYKVVSTYTELQVSKLMRLIPLFGHFARFQMTNDKRADTIKNIKYGSGKGILDVYIGGSLTNPTYSSVDDDTGSDYTVESNGSPVVIYVYGGAWDSGHKSMLLPMAQNLANQGYIVVVPDYTHYPEAKIETMVKDIQEVVLWTSVNITRYGGDPNNIYLMGSGSGAHIASLAIIKDAVDQLGGIPPPKLETDSTPVVDLPLWPEMPHDTQHQQLQLHTATDKATQLKERVHGLILFSGVFDITFYYAYLHKRGIEEVSAMPRVMHQSPNNYLACSPSWLLANASATLEHPELLVDVLPKSILIIHGEQDRLIPAHSSQTFFKLLCSAEIPNTKFKLYKDQGHLDPAIDLIFPTNPMTASLLSDLAEAIRPVGFSSTSPSSSVNGSNGTVHGTDTPFNRQSSLMRDVDGLKANSSASTALDSYHYKQDDPVFSSTNHFGRRPNHMRSSSVGSGEEYNHQQEQYARELAATFLDQSDRLVR